MVKNNSIYDVFNNPIALYFGTNSGEMYLSTKIDKNAYEQCINLYQIVKQFHSFLWQTVVFGADKTYNTYGDRFCPKADRCLKNMTFPQITQHCNDCRKKNVCKFNIYIGNDFRITVSFLKA